MTNEQAIKWLKAYIQDTPFQMEQYERAFEMAIKALSQEPKYRMAYDYADGKARKFAWIWGNGWTEIEQEPCDDAISRKDAEQMFRNIRCHLKPQDYKSAEEFNTRDLMLLNAEQMIHALPSVTQKPKTGHWIEHPEIETSAPEYLMFYECSECGDRQCFCKSDIHKKRFCSNCGAKMESEVNNG